MKRILVRTPQWLGDAVVSTVFLTRLKAKETQSEISVLCPVHLASIFESHPAVNKVIALPAPKSILNTAKMIREGTFDEVYILPRSFRAALESYLGHVPVRIGYSGDLRQFLLTRRIRYDANHLYAHRYLRLINEESLDLNLVAPFFPSSTPANLPRPPLLGMAPVSIAPSRTWFPERFAEVANRWQKKTGGSVVLFGSASEVAAVQVIADKIEGPMLNAAGKLTLAELGGAIRQCQLFICNDSGLMHVASAFRVPTVVIFGASEPAVALPPWGKFIALQHKEIFCVPCLRNHCVRLAEGHLACLKAVTTDEVLEAIPK